MFYINEKIIISISFLIIEQNIFQFISSATHGGAIIANREDLIINLFRCSFFQCVSNQYGGGFAILSTLKFYGKSNCISECKAYSCPGFVLWGNGYKLLYSEFNYSDDNNPYSCHHASGLISSKLISTKINVSNSRFVSFSGGLYIGSSNSENIISFSQFSNCIATSFLGFCNPINYINPIFSFLNFINNQVSISWFEIHNSITNPILNNCYFKENNIQPLIRYYGGSGSITFNSCYFDYINPSINSNNNYFNINISILSINLLNTFYCYNNITLFSKKILPKSIFSLNCII